MCSKPLLGVLLALLAIPVAAFADAGRVAIELGGPGGFTVAPSVISVTVTPEISWFVADNLELVGFTHLTTEMPSEPSDHLPFPRGVFAWLGIGGYTVKW